MSQISGFIAHGIQSFEELTKAINDAIGKLQTKLLKVPSELIIVGASTPSGYSAGAPFAIQHRLGLVPKTIDYFPWAAGATLNATVDDRRQWTATQVVVRSSVSPGQFDITVKS